MAVSTVTEPVCVFYGTIHNIKLVINLPGDQEAHVNGPNIQSMLYHMKAVAKKVKAIKSLDGLPALLKKIEMTGINDVEKVKVTYEQNEQDLVRKYTVDQFYKL